MADPAWGTASSLSDEETARALCAFHDTEPLPTQRRRPLQQQQQQQQQAPLYRPSDQRSREVPQLGGFSAFGYPTSGAYHMVPMTVQRGEAASVLVGMPAPSTSSDDWQQRRIQQELEQQQRELQAVTQSQQQQDMQRQLHQLQAQIQQQQREQAHRHHQAQVQRQVERIQEPPHYSSSGLGGFDQTGWNNGAYAQSSAASSFSGADSGRIQGAAMQHGVQMQQNGRIYGGDFQQRAQPVPIRPATTPTGTGSYPAFSYGEGSQPAGMLASRHDALFAPQQMPQPAQSHFRARSTDLFGASALQSWGRSGPMSLSGMQQEKPKSFQTQSDPRFVPQQQQPQPYYASEPSERKYQEPPARSRASQSVPDVFFLDGVMRHFPTSSETIGEAPTRSTAVPAMSNRESVEVCGNAFEFAPTQYRTQAQPPIGMQTQMEVQSRTTVPPTGAVIVPGVSLASQPIRLVTMRDLLNGDEAKADKARGRPRGNQQRAPQKRKAPKKKAPAKRQRMPQQPNEQRPQHPPMNRSVRPSQNPSLVPNGGPTLASKPAPPMYLAFMESRAARALEQKSGAACANPPVPEIRTAQSQLSVPATQDPPRQTNSKAVDLVAAEAIPVTQKKRGVYKRKKTGIPPDTQTQEQSVRTSMPSMPPTQATSQPTVALNKELPEVSPTKIAAQVVKDVLVNDQAKSSSISDDPVNGKFGQLQEPPPLAVPVDAVKSVERSLNKDKTANGKLDKSSRGRRTTKLSQPGSDEPVSSALPVPAGASTEVVSSTAIAAASSPADNPPRVENRTVVIFCKRDFMRYQAAKIWRKYQEQLKKQEEWREVRVAGKRTRYLNSRYDDELRRTHRKPTTKRPGNRPRGRPAAQKNQETNGHEVSALEEATAAVSLTASASTSASNGNDEGGHLTRDPGKTSATDAAGSGTSVDACDTHSSGANAPGKAEKGSLVTLQGASDLRQGSVSSSVLKQGEEAGANNMDGSRVLNEPSNGMMIDSINSTEWPATATDINQEVAIAGVLSTSKDGVAGVVADIVLDDKAIPSTGVPSNDDVKLAISDAVTNITDAGGADTEGTGGNLVGCAGRTTSSGSIDTIVSSAAMPRQGAKGNEALNDDASCSSGKRRSSTSADLNQAHRDSINQACAVPAMTSDDSVQTCTSSRMSFMPNGVTTSDDGGNPADASIQLDRDPSGTTIVAKPIPISSDLETATNGGTTEINPCAASPISDSLNLGKPAHADPVVNSNGSAAV